jgi:hypothetical protein
MNNARLGRIALISAVLFVVTLAPGAASASGYEHAGWARVHDPSQGYTYPIQMLFQFPAVIVNQPGSEIPFLWPDPSRSLLGGRPYLYHH